MVTQLGGNARQNAASERKECTILVFCLSEGEQERNVTSEKGEAGVRCGRVFHQGCCAEIQSFSVKKECSYAQVCRSIMIPSAPSGRKVLKSIDVQLII